MGYVLFIRASVDARVAPTFWLLWDAWVLILAPSGSGDLGT